MSQCLQRRSKGLVGTDDVVLVGLKKQKQQLEYEIEEYRQETEEVKNLRKKIGEIEGRHEAFRSAEDEAKLMSLQQKLGTALRATGRGSVHYRACVRCMRVWWWDETEERKRHHTRSRQKMLEKIAKAKPMIGNEEDDEEPQMADGVDPMMWNIRVYVVEGARKLSDHPAVSGTVILAIVVAAVLAGIEVGLDAGEETPSWMRVCEWIVLSLFTIEVAIKVVMEGRQPWNYFRFKMNVFDFAVVCICWATILIGGSAGSSEGSDEASTFVASLRSLRLLRVVRLFDQIPELRVILAGANKGMEAILFIMLLILLVFYVFAIFALYVFGDNDPFHFPNLHTGMISLFRAATGEDWTDIMYISIYGCDFWGYSDEQASAERLTFASRHLSTPAWVDCGSHPTRGAADTPGGGSGWSATVYWIIFFMLVAFVGLNLFVAVVTTAMGVAQDEKKWTDFDRQLMRKLRKMYSSKEFEDNVEIGKIDPDELVRSGKISPPDALRKTKKAWVLTELKINNMYKPVFGR